MSDGAILVLAVALVGVGAVIYFTGERAIDEAARTRQVIERVDRNTAPLLRAGSRVVEQGERLGII